MVEVGGDVFLTGSNLREDVAVLIGYPGILPVPSFVICDIRQPSRCIKTVLKPIPLGFYLRGHQAIKGVFKAIGASIRMGDASQVIVCVYDQCCGDTVGGYN